MVSIRGLFERGKTPGLGLLALILLAWEVASETGAVDPFYLPSVGRILTALARAIGSGELPEAIGTTLLRVFTGYLIGVVVGVVIGALTGYFRTVYNTLEPLIELLRPLPSAAIIPIAILFLGIEDRMKVFIVAWGAFFPIVVNTADGVRGVEPTLLETAKTFGLGQGQTMRSIIIPAAAPAIMTGLRVSLALALILAVIAEMVAGNTGIGFFILDAERSFKVPEMYAGTLALAGVGYALNWLFVKADGRFMHWHRRAGREAAI